MRAHRGQTRTPCGPLFRMVHLIAIPSQVRQAVPMSLIADLAAEVLARCDRVAGFSEEAGCIKRTFLCESMHGLHECLSGWMTAAGMQVRRDPIGNLIGRYPAPADNAPVFLIGSHLDSVPNA